jgi:uncharacterized protein
VLDLDDLSEGLELTGTVLNVVDFGAFVDIGLKDSGLVHISRMADRYIQSPHDLVAVGDRITVWVLGVDKERRRVSLTMVPPGPPSPQRAPGSQAGPRSVPADQAGDRLPVISPKIKRQSPAQPVAADAAAGNGAAPRTSGVSEPGPSGSAAPRSKPHSKRRTDPPPLSTEMLSGHEPLRGFDELKELWKHRT